MADLSKVRLHPWMVSALQLALAGHTEEQIAQRLQQKVTRVRRFLVSPWTQTQLTNFNTSVLMHAAKSRVDPINRFQSLTDRAIGKLEKLLEAEDEKVQFLTACRIIDNAGHAPEKRLRVTNADALDGRTLDELRAIAAGRIKARDLRTAVPGQPLANGALPAPGTVEGESEPA